MLLHDSSRAICQSILAEGMGKAENLDVFESAQHRLIGNLAYFITLAVSRNSHAKQAFDCHADARTRRDYCHFPPNSIPA